MKENFSKSIIGMSLFMLKETLEAGISRYMFDTMFRDLYRLSDKDTIALYSWCEELRVNEHAAILKIRTCVPAYVWENYRINKPPRELPEQKLLRGAQQALKQRWKIRPIFKRKRIRHATNKTNDQGSPKTGS